MKATARLAALAATFVLVAGCNCMRHKERPIREPVQLPGAPSLEPGPATSTVPSTSGPMSPPTATTVPTPAAPRN